MCEATSKKDNKLFVYVFILGIYIQVVGFNALSMRERERVASFRRLATI